MEEDGFSRPLRVAVLDPNSPDFDDLLARFRRHDVFNPKTIDLLLQVWPWSLGAHCCPQHAPTAVPPAACLCSCPQQLPPAVFL